MCISLFLCDSLLLDVCANCCFVYPQVPPVLAQKVFTQIFSYINVQLFNRWTYISSFVSCMPGNLRSTWVHECFLFCSLLLRRECCSFSNGEYVKAGLAELELWCAKATTEVICLCLNASFPSYMIQFTEAPSFFFHTVCCSILGWAQAYQAGCWLSGMMSILLVYICVEVWHQ